MFRTAELYQNEGDFQSAIDTYKSLLVVIENKNEGFMREKTLMRLAESCYRVERIQEGMGFLEKLQKDILPKRIYTIYLLKGKYRDLQKDYKKASEEYKQALNVYQEDFISHEPLIKGNI